MSPTRIRDRIDLSVEDGVAHVQLARPERLNALDAQMLEALVETGDALAARTDLRSVVLSGAGRAFCAGIDMQTLQTAAGGGGLGIDIDRPFRGDANIAQHAVLQWRELPVPVIAAVHGAALGGGLQLALGADIRIFARDAKLALAEVRWGLIPDMAGFLNLRRLIGRDQIVRLACSGETIDGIEAVRIGLATEVAVDPLQRAQALAAEISSHSGTAVRAAKRLVDVTDARELLRAEAAEQLQLIGSPEQKRIVEARLARRTDRP